MKLPRLNSSKFTHERSAERNGVFLIKAHPEEPFLRAVDGWKMIGYGKAPWPRGDSDFAVMLEKQTPPDESKASPRGEEFGIGELIWHHWDRGTMEALGIV